MIKNFEEITHELSARELDLIQPLIELLNLHLKTNPIKAPEIARQLNILEPRLRKMVNYIRTNGLLPLIATSTGYYVTNDRTEIQSQIESLQQRARSIDRCAKGLNVFLNDYQQRLFND